MSETNKNIARPLYAATESGDVSILDSVLAVNAVEHPLNPGQARGREAIKQLFGGFHLIVPDLSITVEDIIADGDRVAVRSTVRGTPTVPYLGVEPAGRPMTFGAIDIWRVADGRVAEGWHVEDFLRVLVDWGVVPVPRRSDPAANSRNEPGGDHPGEDDPKAVVGAWYQALHRQDRRALAVLLDRDFVNHDPIGPGAAFSVDRDGTLDDVDALHGTFPDLDVTLADLFAERGMVVARVIIRGTQLGSLLGIAPSGGRAAVMGNEIWWVKEGRILEHWGRYEELDLLRQLAVLPAR